jgi:hypothetical protein
MIKEDKELPWKDKTDKQIELVYFIIDFNDHGFSHVKIGKCVPKNFNQIEDPANEKAVYSRLSSCSTGNPRKLYVLGYIFSDEKYWHHVLGQYNTRGEWFNFDMIKGILFHLKLQPVEKSIKDWKDSLHKILWDEYYNRTRFEFNDDRKEFLEKEREKKQEKIDRYTYKDFLKIVTNSNYGDIVNDALDNRWQTGRGEFGNNQIMNTYSTHSRQISKLLDLMFEGADTQIKTKKGSILDNFNDVIHDGDPYFNLEGQGWTSASGISLRNAVYLWDRANPKLREIATNLVEKDEEKLRIENIY